MNKGLIEDPWTYRFFPTELVFFLLGMVDYSIYRKVISYNIKPFFLWLVFSYILSFTILYNFIAFSGSMLFYFLSFFLSIPFVFLLFKENIIDRFIGELSYPIYISHLLMLTVLNYINKKIFIGNDGLTLTVLTVIFSVLLKNYVSEKIERIRQKRLLG
jgi:peptidoglycan/LPS O-acetylase OafA/YrhL